MVAGSDGVVRQTILAVRTHQPLAGVPFTRGATPPTIRKPARLSFKIPLSSSMSAAKQQIVGTFKPIRKIRKRIERGGALLYEVFKPDQVERASGSCSRHPVHRYQPHRLIELELWARLSRAARQERGLAAWRNAARLGSYRAVRPPVGGQRCCWSYRVSLRPFWHGVGAR